MKHLLKLKDLDQHEILDILNLADQLKYETKHGIEHHLLKGKTLGMIFQKSSTRTRVSFETGMYQLGGQALFLSNRDLQIGRGEPVQDTARVLSRYLDGIMIRTFAQQEVEDLAAFGSIPIINGLTDYAHPCQVLADLMTIREYKHSFKGLKLCFIGDGNNMANSLMVGCIKMGMSVAIACPENYKPDAALMKWAAENGASTLIVVKSFLYSHKVEQQGYKSCTSLMRLADRYTPQNLEQACERALSFTPAPSLKNISIILKNKLEKIKEEKVQYSKGSQYGITRGASYYGGGR